MLGMYALVSSPFYFMGEISVGRRILMSIFETRLANLGLSLCHPLSSLKLFQYSLRWAMSSNAIMYTTSLARARARIISKNSKFMYSFEVWLYSKCVEHQLEHQTNITPTLSVEKGTGHPSQKGGEGNRARFPLHTARTPNQ